MSVGVQSGAVPDAHPFCLSPCPFAFLVSFHLVFLPFPSLIHFPSSISVSVFSCLLNRFHPRTAHSFVFAYKFSLPPAFLIARAVFITSAFSIYRLVVFLGIFLFPHQSFSFIICLFLQKNVQFEFYRQGLRNDEQCFSLCDL